MRGMLECPDPPVFVMPQSRNFVLYDGDCPFCTNYVKLLRLRQAVGQVDLLNVREQPELARTYAEQGYDLDKGMLLHLDGQDYFGADCINRLALLSTGNDLFNQFNAMVFSNACLSRALYPFMSAGRHLALRVLGRSRFTA